MWFPGGGPNQPGPSAMDLFPDGSFVRLQNRAREEYLAADDDGEGVSLRPHRGDFSLNTVWRVQHVGTFVLLQGAAYGRYLASVHGIGAPSGCRGRRAVQRDYVGGRATNAPQLKWAPFRMADDDDRYIVLRHAFSYDRNLRANGRYRFWHTAVTADFSQPRWSTMMQWTVRTLDLAPGVPPLEPVSDDEEFTEPGRLRRLFQRLRPEPENERRTIWYVWANDEGDFDQNSDSWSTFSFDGRSVSLLMTDLVVLRQPDGGEDWVHITLAVRPGSQGRLTPLVTDLPRSLDAMDIVVFRNGSQGAQNLVFPNIH